MKRTNAIKLVYVLTFFVGVLMLLLQAILLNVNNLREAKNTTKAYVIQTEKIIENNEREEEALLASLKEEYIVLSKAVAYYLDECPDAVNDIDELNKICNLMSIDEIHIFDETGTIISSTYAGYIGLSFDDGEQIGYFKPMLKDKTLSMCQDITENTAEGKPMMYAITWNEAGNQMVQIGIEPVRLIEVLEKNEIQKIVDNITLDKKMSIIIANNDTLEVVASSIDEYVSLNLTDVTNLTEGNVENGFRSKVKLIDKSGTYFCNISINDDYCICIFQSSKAYLNQTLESLVIVTIYLLIAVVAISLVIRKLISSKEAIYEHLQIFNSMSEIYYSLHLCNLKENTAIEYSSRNQVKAAFNVNSKLNATELMVGIMHATMSDEYLQRGLEFTDLSTLSERMKDKKIISAELLGKNVGWIRMSFITFEEENGYPTKVIISTQIIDEEKKNAEMLYNKSYLDEMTSLYNRRAYNTDIAEFEDNPSSFDFTYISFDVNGLKTINDNLGHEAGDELLCGATKCMQNVFSKYGKIYRTGGDEFVGLVHADKDLMEILSLEFENELKNYKGNMINEISCSFGYVLPSEINGMSIIDIANLADKRMYEAKERYYKEKGIERRRT